MNTSHKNPSYIWLCLSTTIITAVGFSSTYFGPLLAGDYPDVSPSVHIHGWTFFAWYLLLPLQAGLIAASRYRLHRMLGYCSIALAAAMTATGLLVISVQMDLARQPDGEFFWRLFGPGVFSTLALFVVFYALAIRFRRRRDLHKRFMLLASTGALGAAAFRVLAMLLGPGPLALYGGMILPNIIIVAAMLLERRRGEPVHQVYRWGLAASLLVVVSVLVLTPTRFGKPLSLMLAEIGNFLAPLY